MHASFSSMAEYSFCFHFISLPLNNGNILSSFFFSCSVRCQKGIFSRTTHRYCRSNSSHAKMSATHAENETAREREREETALYYYYHHRRRHRYCVSKENSCPAFEQLAKRKRIWLSKNNIFHYK